MKQRPYLRAAAFRKVVMHEEDAAFDGNRGDRHKVEHNKHVRCDSYASAERNLRARVSSPLGFSVSEYRTERKEQAKRKKTDSPREGWEDGTPPPHRDFKERGVVH